MPDLVVAELVVELAGRWRPLALEGARLIVGSASEADIRLPGVFVSRRHAELERFGSAWRIRDLGSKNGTAVNGRRLLAGEPESLQSHDRVEIGGYVLTYWARDVEAGTLDRASVGPEGLPPLRLQEGTRRAWLGEQELPEEFTPLEFALLTFLADHAPAICPSAKIGRTLWGALADGTPKHDPSMLYSLVYAVRQKLEPDPAAPRYLVTSPRVGYRLLGIPGAVGD